MFDYCHHCALYYDTANVFHVLRFCNQHAIGSQKTSYITRFVPDSDLAWGLRRPIATIVVSLDRRNQFLGTGEEGGKTRILLDFYMNMMTFFLDTMNMSTNRKEHNCSKNRKMFTDTKTRKITKGYTGLFFPYSPTALSFFL
jgi:hypothetical protein